MKIYLLILSGIFSAQILHGQQVYQANDYGGPGTIYLYNSLTGIPPAEELTETGANLTWDLRAFSELNTHPTQIVTPSAAIDQFTFLTICSLGGNSPLECLSVWGNTDQALLLQDSLSLFGLSLIDLQRYQEKTSNRLRENFFGFTVDLGGMATQAVIVYESPDTVLQFPLTYTSSWSSHINWSIDLSATGMNIQYKSSQTRTSEVDAWGTVVTPYDTFTNVIRLRSEIMHQDTLTTDSLSVPVNITQVEYMWFDTAYKLPVLIAQGIITDTIETITVVEYIYEATCPEPTWTADAGSDLYYLDENGEVDVDFHIDQSNANEYTWSFGDGTFETTTDNTTHTYFAAGEYTVAVQGCMTDCLPLNSCTFSANIQFEIVDTITSVITVPGEELGIKLYPNPVQESMVVEIPNAIGKQHFRIVDILGKQVDHGLLTQEKTTISSAKWAEGVYTLQMWNDQDLQRQAIIRFSVIRE